MNIGEAQEVLKAMSPCEIHTLVSTFGAKLQSSNKSDFSDPTEKQICKYKCIQNYEFSTAHFGQASLIIHSESERRGRVTLLMSGCRSSHYISSQDMSVNQFLVACTPEDLSRRVFGPGFNQNQLHLIAEIQGCLRHTAQ